MELLLLTHERELTKKSNTGQLVRACLGDRARLIIWQRKYPDSELIEKLNSKKIALLYPTTDLLESESLSEKTIAQYDGFIVIDATWQQARKIYNRSTYLKKAPKVSITNVGQSSFKRRRNQVDGGLCTAECVAEILKLNSEEFLAGRLLDEFEKFNEFKSVN